MYMSKIYKLNRTKICNGVKTIKVNLGERSYPIIIGTDLLSKIGKLVRTIPNVNSALIITNSKIKSIYGKALIKSLNSVNITLNFILVRDSEKSKSINTWIEVMHKITKFDKGKGACVIALGGGVIGDLAGFVAATYRRGVPLIQVPSTILAQVDSAIGGKTAIDLPFGKNLVGAFYQPRMVVSDISLIKSLPLKEIKNGLAEVMKYAVILDEKLFIYLEKNLNRLLKKDANCLLHIISRCSQLKAGVVSRDEKETTGYRSILNFGHTIGHALEAAASYTKSITHGEAVIMGMLCACDIAKDLGLLCKEKVMRIENLIKRLKISSNKNALSKSRVLDAISYDKKIIGGKLRFILPLSIGHVIVCADIDRKLIEKAIAKRIF